MFHLMLLFEYPSLNGGERSMFSVLDGIRDAGFKITAVAPPSGPLFDALTSRRVDVVPLVTHCSNGKRRPLNELRSDLRQIIANQSPDLLHANSLSMSRLSGPAAAEMRLPSIGHLRDIVKLSDAAIRDVNCHSRLMAVSHATRDWHVAAGLDAAKTHVVYNGIDLQEFQLRPAAGYLHRELCLPPDAMLIGSIGQIGMRKGVDAMLDAASCVASRVANLHVLIVGERFSQKQEAIDYEAQLHRQAHENPLRDKVHFLGRRGDVARLLNELTVLVHAARQEPLGRVLLEAAASGTPIVATDVGGTMEIFPHDSAAAKLIPPDDAAALAEALLEVLLDPSARQRMAQAARSRVEADFDADRAAAALVEHYRQICQ